MACVDLTTSLRTAVMLTPDGQGSLREQVMEVLSALKSALGGRAEGPLITAQTIFLKNPADLEECEFLLQEHYGDSWPVTNFVFQPPCNGASLAMEAWGIGGPSVTVKRYSRHVLSVTYDQMRWVYCAGVRPPPEVRGVYNQARAGLRTADCNYGNK